MVLMLLAVLAVRLLPAPPVTLSMSSYVPAAAGLLSAYPCGTAAFNSQLTLFNKNAGTGRQEWDIQPVVGSGGTIGNTTLVLLRVG
jgi:hypothetical protein